MAKAHGMEAYSKWGPQMANLRPTCQCQGLIVCGNLQVVLHETSSASQSDFEAWGESCTFNHCLQILVVLFRSSVIIQYNTILLRQRGRGATPEIHAQIIAPLFHLLASFVLELFSKE